MVPLWKYDEGEVPRSDGSFANETSEDYSYTYDVLYHKDQLNTSHPDIEMKRCQMQPNDAGRMLYPQECVTNLSLIGVEPDMKRFPRDWLRSYDEWLAWMPRTENYDGGGGNSANVQKLADGPWLTQMFDRANAYYNSVPPYSEFVQAKVAAPVYIVGVRIGFPKGGGVLSHPAFHVPCDGPKMSSHSICGRWRCCRASQVSARHMGATLQRHAAARRGCRAGTDEDLLDVVP